MNTVDTSTNASLNHILEKLENVELKGNSTGKPEQGK